MALNHQDTKGTKRSFSDLKPENVLAPCDFDL